MNVMIYFLLAIIFILSYLIGSVNTSIIVGKCLSGTDVRQYGSGNAGATNALRTLGKKAGILVVLGDCLKAVIAILTAMLILPEQPLAVYLAGVGAVLGHNFPLYFKFKGGKGILVSMVAMLFADWQIALAVIIFSVLLISLTRYVSLGSILGALAFILLSLVFRFGDWSLIIFAVFMGGLAIFMHRTNIKRLLSGTESKLGQKKKEESSEEKSEKAGE